MIQKHLTKIIALFALILVILLIWKSQQANTPYNTITLSRWNNIVNESQLIFIDTTVSVGLDAAGVFGATVLIRELTPEVKARFQQDQVGVELAAAIVGNRSQFILYVSNTTRLDAIKVIAHEVIHLMQYRSARLMIVPPDKILWEGDTLTRDDLYNMTYVDRPWEREAFDGEDGLSDKMEQILYGKNM